MNTRERAQDAATIGCLILSGLLLAAAVVGFLRFLAWVITHA